MYSSLFPLITSLRVWDIDDGDAEYMAGVPDETFDFVHSSHCLEHLRNPVTGLKNWLRILRAGGYMIVTIPDEDLYEQGTFPSTFNKDHKHTFTINKTCSWSPASISVIDLVHSLGAGFSLHKIELIDHAYRYDLPRFDQTLTPVSESAIEMIVRRNTPEEIAFGGIPVRREQPDTSVRLHLNQYMDDIKTLKAANISRRPFKNDSEI
jgi:SAM-dependent methyltransferase